MDKRVRMSRRSMFEVTMQNVDLECKMNGLTKSKRSLHSVEFLREP